MSSWSHHKSIRSRSPIALQCGNKVAYDKAKCLMKQLIAEEYERERLGELLVRDNGQGRVLRIVKQVNKEIQDVTGSGNVNDTDGKIVVEDAK